MPSRESGSPFFRQERMQRAVTPLDASGFEDLPGFIARLENDKRPAVVEGGRRLSRHDLFVAAAQLAASLPDFVTPGARVALLGPSGADWLAAFLGISSKGALPVLIDPRLASTDIRLILAHAKPCAIVTDRRLDLPLPQFAFPAAGASTARGVGGGINSASPAVIVYTSGTSGTPKGVVLSHAALSAQAAAALATSHGAALFRRHLMVLPLNFLLGLNAALATLHSGGQLIFCNSLMPTDILDLQREHHATGMVAVPRLLETLDRALAVARRDAADGLHALDDFFIVCGGAALDETLRLRLEGRGVRVFPGYGMTEAGPTITASTPDALRAGTVGRPYPGVEVAIDDTNGEVLVRSPSLMLGYLRDEAGTDAALRDGWLRTGDIGRLDEDGFLAITGRLKDLIVLSSGKKVAPEKIETRLVTEARLAECCLLEDRGTLILVAVPRAGESACVELERRVRAACRLLAPHERPSTLRFRTEALPRTATGKLRRHALHDELSAVAAAAVAP
jgi:long-chain acyl-CoA synthetase